MSKLANLHHPGSEDHFWDYEATSADYYEKAEYWALSTGPNVEGLRAKMILR